MSQTKIEKLAPEQEALIPVYREKWRSALFSPKPINQEKAAAAVKAVYEACGLSEPEVFFCRGINEVCLVLISLCYGSFPRTHLLGRKLSKPLTISDSRLSQSSLSNADYMNQFKYATLSEVEKRIWHELAQVGCKVGGQLERKVKRQLKNQLQQPLERFLNRKYDDKYSRENDIYKTTKDRHWGDELRLHLDDYLWKQWDMISLTYPEITAGIKEYSRINPKYERELLYELGYRFRGYLYLAGLFSIAIYPNDWVGACSYFDFCIRILKCSYNRRKWSLLKSLVLECGWLYLFNGLCLVCGRPINFSLDDNQRFHAEGKPAIQFADGFCVYAYHGVTLPEEYGKLHFKQWQSQWLLEEDNAELRRVLIQGIGYERICSELQATELDSWAEYTLLKIENDVDIEPIHLLKMTCSSTGRVHMLRVPPEVSSAREAIHWVNWGIDPEEFSVQT